MSQPMNGFYILKALLKKKIKDKEKKVTLHMAHKAYYIYCDLFF